MITVDRWSAVRIVFVFRLDLFLIRFRARGSRCALRLCAWNAPLGGGSARPPYRVDRGVPLILINQCPRNIPAPKPSGIHLLHLAGLTELLGKPLERVWSGPDLLLESLAHRASEALRAALGGNVARHEMAGFCREMKSPAVEKARYRQIRSGMLSNDSS